MLDPECGASGAVRDQFEFIRSSLQAEEVDYFVVSFSQKLSAFELADYLRKFDDSSQTFIWKGDYVNIPETINKMVYPTFILVDSSGKVIKTFPGTDKTKSVREKMSIQIIKEVTKEKQKS